MAVFSTRGVRRSSVLIAALMVAVAPVGAAADAPVEVASGLDNPKGLAFGADGTLYVAEAGVGGDAPCFEGAEGEMCAGSSGAVTAVRHGVQERIVEGLPSAAAPGGFGAAGPHDVALLGNGNLVVPIGLGGPPDLTAPGGVLAGTGMGTLVRVNGRSGSWKTIADIAAFEGATNPDGVIPPDSNPFGVLALPGETLVVDAGANAVFSVTPAGKTSTFAVFPATPVDFPFPGFPMQAVPTAIAEGPDGHFYVGQLTGFPFPVGGARVFELDASGAVVDTIDGFTNIVDVATGPDGSLYVVQISSSGLLGGEMDGQVWRVAPNGARTLVVPFVFAPGGAAVGPDGDLYVTTGTILPDAGAVLRFDLP